MDKKAASQSSIPDILNKLKGTEEGQEALKHWSPGEIGWTAVGAGGAGLLAYLLSGVGGKRGKGRRLLYTLLGMLAGGAGTQAVLNRPAGDGFDGSLRDKLRISKIFTEPVGGGDSAIPKEHPMLSRIFNAQDAKKAITPNYFNTSAGLLGAALGASGSKFAPIDASGVKRMQRSLDRFLGDVDNSAKGRLVRDLVGQRQGVTGDLRALLASTDPRDQALVQRVGEMNARGLDPINRIDNNYRIRATGMDRARDALANGALYYGGAAAAHYLANRLNAPSVAYHPELDINRLVPRK